MYLKSIRLDGFKSFADKTIFEFEKGITGIVGPNGSGKSNIVDAIRWVLGEQSVKSLRGGIMSDVIFNGSNNRNPLNKASVTLTFDNTDKYLNTEYTEISVKRSIYKDGENEYFLNDTKVRLKDILDLFMDGNLSNDSMNIISQGSVTDIVNSKPNERRVIIESAAGVLKYKKRKEESLRKLEKTKDNINSINLVINELTETITPLKKDAETAKKYLEFKEELKKNEVSLLAKDITSINSEISELQIKEEELTKKLDTLKDNKEDSKIESIKLDIYKVDDEISTKNKKIIELTEEISNLSSEKRITIERTKYEYSKEDIKNNLINLKENELNLVKDIEIINSETKVIEEKINTKNKEKQEIEKELKSIISNRTINTDNLNILIKDKFTLENKIEILENNILNSNNMPASVKNILNNPRLKGIHDTISNIITVDNKYMTSVDAVMGASANFLVVDSEDAAKDAINYLKEQNLGRATFLPLNIIKSRLINNEIKNNLENINGYVGILSNLVEYDSKYQNIIENQLGNVIVAKDIDAMNEISKKVEYKYRVVALDGSIIYAGGSISGGTLKKSNNINLRKDLEENKNKLNNIIIKIDNLNDIIKNINKDGEIVTNKLNSINGEIISLNSLLENKNNLLNEQNDKLRDIRNDINGINNALDNSLDKTLENIMNRLNDLNIEKEKQEISLNELKNKKEDLNNKLKELEDSQNSNNQSYKQVSSELNVVNVNQGKLNVKLDNLLLTLNEDYSMTYEYAYKNSDLDIDVDIVRSLVTRLKNDIKSLGEVNVGSISEYDRLNERLTFLNNQKNDLEVSIENLIKIITDMDEIMIDKFKTTFDKVAIEFSKIFKIMFKGGMGELKLTEPNDILNTGVDLIIMPPGKKIQNTQSLSGGEKSLAAICLLFAILNVTPVPFIVLDEIEAALDEANVDLFGEYLNKKKNDSQYILITHKKRMMEYADVLYGITMQQPGISKVVGVKLENV